MRSLYLAIELRGAGLDVNMPNTLVFDMPVEQSLKFMSSIGTYLLNTEPECVDDMIDKVIGIFLGMSRVNLQRPNPCCIIDGRVFIAFELSTILSFEHQKLNIHLDVVTWNLFIVTFGVDLSPPRTPGQTIDTVSFYTL